MVIRVIGLKREIIGFGRRKVDIRLVVGWRIRCKRSRGSKSKHGGSMMRLRRTIQGGRWMQMALRLNETFHFLLFPRILFGHEFADVRRFGRDARNYRLIWSHVKLAGCNQKVGQVGETEFSERNASAFELGIVTGQIVERCVLHGVHQRSQNRDYGFLFGF